MNDLLEKELSAFISRFENESKEVKSHVHYHSTLNITNQLLKISDEIKRFKKCKESTLSYFEELKPMDFPTGKLISNELFHNYLFETGSFLIKERDFRDNKGNVIKYISVGIVIDIIIYFISKNVVPFYFPITTLIFTYLGFKRREKAIIEKKAIGVGY